MKRRIVLATIVAILISAIHVFGQEKKTVPDSVVVKTELINKYEAEKKTIIELISKRIDELAKADPIYNQLAGMKSSYEKLLKELKPTEIKPKVNK